MKTLLNGIEYVFMRAAALFFIVFVVCIFLQLLSRYVPTITLLWPAEVATYAFIWMVFLGAAVMVYHQEHFKIDYLFEKLQGRALLTVKMISHILIGGFGLMMIVHGSSLYQLFWEWTVNTLPELQQGYLWLALPVAGFGMLLFSIGNAIEDGKAYQLEKGGETG
ncbi:LOW QUALITY PROTEIN: TRAP-type C4-dicarboxylate transport system, small permease component [Geomicrobium sp. JCM 19037]|nr:LOW QUALITY PROTEIN: TRAP-type C4-dicarboxylate transport system, small permease component [Geomicrobium sp. JCM 19037]